MMKHTSVDPSAGQAPGVVGRRGFLGRRRSRWRGRGRRNRDGVAARFRFPGKLESEVRPDRLRRTRLVGSPTCSWSTAATRWSVAAGYSPTAPKGHAAKKFKVPEDKRFTGLSAYERLLDAKPDAIVIESPPYFHPEQAAPRAWTPAATCT